MAVAVALALTPTLALALVLTLSLANLQDGLAAGRIERWRGGDAIDQRPLSALRAAELEGAASRDVKLQLQES